MEHCLRCDHEWNLKKIRSESTSCCPKCRSYTYDRPYTPKNKMVVVEGVPRPIAKHRNSYTTGPYYGPKVEL